MAMLTVEMGIVSAIPRPQCGGTAEMRLAPSEMRFGRE
jgi:hypothetical protein